MDQFLRTMLISLVLVATCAEAQETRWQDLQSQAQTFLERRKYKEGLPVAQEALREAERVFGPEHANVAASLFVLAELHRGHETCLESVALHQRALAIREKALGAQNLDVAASLDSLGSAYSCLAQREKAKPLHERALAIRQELLGPNDPRLAESLWAVGWHSDSLSLYERAMAIWEKTLDPKSPEMADRLWQMAHQYASHGRRTDAEPLYRRSLAIQERLANPDAWLLADTLEVLSGFYLEDLSNKEKINQGLALQLRAVEIKDKIRDKETNEFALRLDSLAALYERLGRFDEAEAVKERMLAVELQRLGPDHLHLVEPYRRVAAFYSRRARFARAEALYKRALEIMTGQAEASYLEVVLGEYAELLEKMNRVEDARNTRKRAQAIRSAQEDDQMEELFREVVAELETVKPADIRHEHKDAAEFAKGYVDLLRRTARADQAAKLEKLLGEINAQADLNEKYLPEEFRVKDMLKMAEEQFGPEHPVVASFLEEYAVILRKMNRGAEAKLAEERAKKIRSTKPKAQAQKPPPAAEDAVLARLRNHPGGNGSPKDPFTLSGPSRPPLTVRPLSAPLRECAAA